MNFLKRMFGRAEKPVAHGPQNSIMVINPYLYQGVWVFDDPTTGLVKEALVAGVPEILEALHEAHNIPDAGNGFVLIFGAIPFPGYHAKGEWVREEAGGNVYGTFLPNGKWQEGWLCPALFKYFEKAPRELYIQVKPRK